MVFPTESRNGLKEKSHKEKTEYCEVSRWIEGSYIYDYEDENDLGLKGSILDRLYHVVGEVEGEQRLVELEPIVNRPHLSIFSFNKFYKVFSES